MLDEIEALAAFKRDPDTNRALMGMLLDECMDPPEYIAIMKVLTVIMREVE